MDGNQETSASEINTNTTIPQQDFDDDVDEVKANVECYSTMSQTTYDLIVSIPYHLSLKTICFMIFYGFFLGGGWWLMVQDSRIYMYIHVYIVHNIVHVYVIEL